MAFYGRGAAVDTLALLTAPGYVYNGTKSILRRFFLGRAYRVGAMSFCCFFGGLISLCSALFCSGCVDFTWFLVFFSINHTYPLGRVDSLCAPKIFAAVGAVSADEKRYREREIGRGGFYVTTTTTILFSLCPREAISNGNLLRSRFEYRCWACAGTVRMVKRCTKCNIGKMDFSNFRTQKPIQTCLLLGKNLRCRV